MNEKIKQIKESVKNLQKQIKEQEESLGDFFEDGLKNLLVENPDIENIHMGLNNHEFNDGDATYFSLHYEEPSIRLKDDTEYEGYWGEDKDITPEQKRLEGIRNYIIDFFKSFDVGNFYESKFSDAYEGINFSWDGEKLDMS